jgi:hypothetical protein
MRRCRGGGCGGCGLVGQEVMVEMEVMVEVAATMTDRRACCCS